MRKIFLFHFTLIWSRS